MNPRYRIYAAVGGIGVLLLLGVFMLLGRGGSTEAAAAPTIKPLHPVKKAAPARARAARPVAKAKPATALAPPNVAKTDAATDGMPAQLAAALAKHAVVIVSLVVPDAPVDEMAYREAQAGAAKAGVGFVRINASNNDDVQALSTLVDTNADPGNRLLDSPATLVFRHPHDLYVRINGYVDADTIAQAAANAAPVSPVESRSAALGSAWVTKVNAACTQLKSTLTNEAFPTQPSEMVAFLRKLTGDVKATVGKIRALKPPKGKEARVAAMLAAYDRMLEGIDAELDAVQHRQLFKLAALQSRIEAAGAAGDQIAAELGATACSG